MKYLVTIFLFSIGIFTSCEQPRPVNSATSQGPLTIDPNEEYVMVTTAVNLPLYVNHDQAAFKRWGEQKGVQTAVLGPPDWNVPAQIATIEQVIATRPAGLLINGTDPGIAQAINQAVEAGIPTVVYDSDIPESKRHCFLGTNWYEIGQLQGEAMVELINGKGKVAYMGILGMTNMEAGFQGLLDVLAQHPGIEVVGKFDDKNSVETAARITSDLVSAHPDIAGIAGFDSNSGPGIALALKEAGKNGQVKVTTVDAEPGHLKLVKEGVIHHLVGQKRELFTWYGAEFLFDMAHRTNQLSKDDAAAGITSIPHKVNTGLFEVNADNVNQFLN